MSDSIYTIEQIVNQVYNLLDNASVLYLPNTAINTVVFSFHGDKLRVLLLRILSSTRYNLPGGYVGKTEDLDDAAYRILHEMSGLENIYLDQFYTSGGLASSEDKTIINALEELGVHLPTRSWLESRFVSVCYYALIDGLLASPRIDPMVASIDWFDVAHLPELLYDHKIVIDKALQRLQLDLDKKLLGFNLTPEEFTMGELQKLYEAIHQTKLDRASFQRKILSMNILERLQKKHTGKAHKSPYLYRFIKQKP